MALPPDRTTAVRKLYERLQQILEERDPLPDPRETLAQLFNFEDQHTLGLLRDARATRTIDGFLDFLASTPPFNT